MFFSQDGEHETDDLSSQGADERDRSSIRGGSPFVEREREANLSSCDMDLTRTVMEGKIMLLNFFVLGNILRILLSPRLAG